MSESDKTIEEGSGSREIEMSFLQHLEELRWRLIYAVIGLFTGTIVAWVFIDPLVEHVLLVPAQTADMKLQNLRPFGQLFLYLQVAMIAGFVLSLPNIFLQLWKFIAPALHKSERKYIVWIVIFSTICFLSGIVFAYFIMLPLTLKFAVAFGTPEIENNFAITEYFSIIISVMLAAGLVFELPMLSFFLSKLGILTPRFMRKYRRHALVVILIIAAMLTPGTDPVAQLLLAVPLGFLYEISIFVSKLSQKKN
ncbi:MAG: Sec-independent protein translocase protein TatC [Melioribacteraceae bacterium]|nr:MAG: Sec-independent protein translocase protein TatC [Melioribacteraceae bacterium]